MGPHVIAYLQRMQIGRVVRSEGAGIRTSSKRGYPTMGGMMILFSIAISVLLWARLDKPVCLVLCCWVLIGYGIVRLYR